jgi:GTP-binding protein
MADIPGIIEGAHEGKGIGLRFLRHIERNSTLLFMIACDSKDIIEEYKILLNELKQFNPELLDKKRLLAITKSDLMDDELEEEMRKDINKRLKGKNKVPFIFISAATGKNILQLKDMLWEQLN